MTEGSIAFGIAKPVEVGQFLFAILLFSVSVCQHAGQTQSESNSCGKKRDLPSRLHGSNNLLVPAIRTGPNALEAIDDISWKIKSGRILAVQAYEEFAKGMSAVRKAWRAPFCATDIAVPLNGH